EVNWHHHFSSQLLESVERLCWRQVDSAHDVPWLDGADGEQYQIKGAQASTGLDEELGVVGGIPAKVDLLTAVLDHVARIAVAKPWLVGRRSPAAMQHGDGSNPQAIVLPAHVWGELERQHGIVGNVHAPTSRQYQLLVLVF